MRKIKIILGVIVSLAFLYLAMRGLNFKSVWFELVHATVMPLVLAGVAFAVAYAARGIRWGTILRGTEPHPGFRELVSAVFIGAGGNCVLPLRAGELIRGFAIWRRGGTSPATAISSIVLERVLDGLTLLALLAILMLVDDYPPWVTAVSVSASMLFLGAALLLIILYIFRGGARSKIERFLNRWKISRVKSITKMLDRLGEGLSLLSSPSSIILAVVMSFVIWSLEAITYWFVGLSLSLNISLAAVLFCLVVVNFALILPALPGAIGTFEYACILGLGVFGFFHNQAFGFAIVLHALFWFILVIGGIVFAWIDHGGFRKLTKDLRDRGENI